MVGCPAHMRFLLRSQSGFFTLVRQNTNEDTREETLAALARHFRLDEPAAESLPFTEE